MRREEERGQRDSEARPLGGGRGEFGRQGRRGGEEDEIDRAAKSTVANFGGVERREGGRESEEQEQVMGRGEAKQKRRRGVLLLDSFSF